MKKICVCVFFFLMLFQAHVSAKGPNEKQLQEKAAELGLMGQLDKANGIVGEKTNFATDKSGGGWDGTSLFLGMIWGAFGTGYFVYGKKTARAMFLFCGIGLCIFPMFVSDNIVSLVLGLVMTILPFKIDV